jgi:WD40 repeat protein
VSRYAPGDARRPPRRPAAYVGEGPVEVWDLSTRRHPRLPLIGHQEHVRGTATAVKGRHLAVTGGDDRSVRIWDLDGRGQIGEPLTGHTSAVDLLTVWMVNDG